MSESCYFVYILLCDNGSYYTGYTTDLARRYQAHIDGTARCKFTRSFKPLKIVQHWQIQGTKSTAMTVERLIKKLSKEEKNQLILFPEILSKFISRLDAAPA